MTELDTDFSNLTNPSADDLPIKYINCVPKIQVNPHIIISNNKQILIIDEKDKPFITPLIETNFTELQKNYKLFWVNESHLSTIIQEIIQTTGKYVYPMIFVNYLKQSLSVNEKINFDNNLLLYIRIWANQIREIARQNNNRFSHSKQKPSNNSNIKYIGYKICCELLYYYKYVTKR